MRLRTKLLRTGAILLVTALMFNVNARAGLVAVAFTPVAANTANLGINRYSLGYEFTVNSPILVTALGYFASPNLSEDHDVAIFNSSGNPIASYLVTGGSALTSNFRYEGISGPTLMPGQTYVIAGTSGLIDRYTYDPTSFSTDPAVTIGRNLFSASPFLIFPIVTQGALTAGYFGPNFQFDLVNGPSPVPEPASVAMAGTAVVIGLAYRWRRRREK